MISGGGDLLTQIQSHSTQLLQLGVEDREGSDSGEISRKRAASIQFLASTAREGGPMALFVVAQTLREVRCVHRYVCVWHTLLCSLTCCICLAVASQQLALVGDGVRAQAATALVQVASCRGVEFENARRTALVALQEYQTDPVTARAVGPSPWAPAGSVCPP